MGMNEANWMYGDYNRNYILPTLHFSNVADELDEELKRKNAFQRGNHKAITIFL